MQTDNQKQPFLFLESDFLSIPFNFLALSTKSDSAISFICVEFILNRVIVLSDRIVCVTEAERSCSWKIMCLTEMVR
jgi:hypothetical protein